jgi:hypothetical protein
VSSASRSSSGGRVAAGVVVCSTFGFDFFLINLIGSGHGPGIGGALQTSSRFSLHSLTDVMRLENIYVLELL